MKEFRELLEETESQDGLRSAGNVMTKFCYNLAKEAGWHNRPDDPLLTPVRLMLIVSELAEAMEGDRKNLMDEHLPHRKSLEVELADAAIRIFDMAGWLGLDVAGAIVEKLQYNARRADHKPENRAQKNGKAY